MTCFNDLIGLEFVYGGRGPERYDCWGLVMECYCRWHGVALPEYTSTSNTAINGLLMKTEVERLWKPLHVAQPGNVLLLRYRGIGAHVGFVHTTTRFLHATEEVGVQEARLLTFRKMIIGAYQYVGG